MLTVPIQELGLSLHLFIFCVLHSIFKCSFDFVHFLFIPSNVILGLKPFQETEVDIFQFKRSGSPNRSSLFGQ